MTSIGHDPSVSPARDAPAHPRSLRLQLMVIVTSTMVLGLGIVLLLDYRAQRTARLADRGLALQDEATLLLPLVRELRHHGTDAVQRYIDEACAQMQDNTSPGHHIAVRLGDDTLQARTHHRASPQILHAMQAAAHVPGHRGQVDSEPILVGVADRDDMTVYVSEYVENVLEANRLQSLRRSGWIALVGLAVIAAMEWALVGLVARPIDRLVSTVRRIGEGALDSRAENFGSREFQYLAGEINSMSAALASAERQRQRQMDKARRIQDRLRPGTGGVGRWSVASLYRPADEVGGDYLDFRLVGDGELIACVADVTGHGVPAAMGAAMLKILFNAAVDRSHDPDQIMRHMHDGFAAVSLDEDFASVIVVVLDQASARLRYASAGHEPAYLLGAGGEMLTLGGTGILMGIEQDTQWETADLDIRPGDRMVLLTDGWAEAHLEDGGMFGRDAVVAALREGYAQSPEGMVAMIAQRVKRVARRPAGDDLTLLVIDWPLPPRNPTIDG